MADVHAAIMLCEEKKLLALNAREPKRRQHITARGKDLAQGPAGPGCMTLK
jgi:hypothetical protein